ncbi:outer membrane protein assembly factor BamD [Gaopeijia maritima]
MILSFSHRTFRPAILMVLALTVGGCTSVPRWQGLTSAQLWTMAQEEFAAGEYGDAVETLERLILGSPGFEQAADAQMMLARAYYLDEKFILAQSEFTRFLDRHPGHPDAPSAALGMCRSNRELSPISQRDQTFTEQALQICRNVSSDWQGTAQADSAATVAAEMQVKLARKKYDTGAYYLRLGVPTAAVLYWEEVVALYPETEWAPAALTGIIDAYTQLGYDDEVEAARTRLLEGYPDSPQAREIGAERGTDGGA